MTDEILNNLKLLRKVEAQYFDSNGKCYFKIIPHQLCELMLELINQLELEKK